MIGSALAALFGLLLSHGPPVAAQNPVAEGRHYFAIQNRVTGNIDQRGFTETLGVAFSNLILTPNTDYRVWVLEVEKKEIGRLDFRTGRPGLRVNLPEIALRPHNFIDVDNDELADIAEFIVGTDPNNPDTDGDGILDGAEVSQGGNPTDGAPVVVGIIDSVTLPGTSVDLCVDDDLLIVAHETGITGLTVFTGMSPAIIGSVATPTAATRVACSGRLVAVALGTSGMSVIDFSAPPLVDIIQQIPAESFPSPSLGLGSVDCVVANSNFAYVGLSNGIVAALDMVSGFVLASVDLSSAVFDLAIAGNTLYAVTNNTLHAIPLDPANLVVASSVNSLALGGFNRVTAGGNFAFTVHNEAFNSFDISMPSQPTLLLAGNTTLNGWRDFATNGSGVGVAAVGNIFGNEDLRLYDVTNPMPGDDTTLNTQFLVQLDTPGQARAVSIANGVAYLADGTAGLQVVNFLAQDSFGMPPMIALAADFDLVTVEEGKRVLVQANVSDDIAIRSVEFFIDGESFTDSTFPFERHFVTPLLSEQPTFTLRARAFDTGGNFTFTNEVVVTLTADASSPVIVNTLPASVGVVGPLTTTIALASEPLDAQTIDATTFTLTGAGLDGILGTGDDVPVIADAIDFRADITGVTFKVDGGLPADRYRGELTSSITDLSGNPLAPETWVFALYANTDIDNNGIPDGLEDFDNDGLINAYEALLGLDPEKADFDAMADSDNDGLLDLNEILLALDPLNPDTDGDGFNESDEIEFSSDPLNPESTPIRSSVQVLAVNNTGGLGLSTQLFSIFNTGALPNAVQFFSVRQDASPEALAGATEPRIISVENTGNP